MSQNGNSGIDNERRKITIEAEDADGIVQLASQLDHGVGRIPDKLEPAVEGLIDAYNGLQIAQERDSRGKQRKKVREYADREDIPSHKFGNMLRVLETFDLAEQDGNRWRPSNNE